MHAGYRAMKKNILYLAIGLIIIFFWEDSLFIFNKWDSSHPVIGKKLENQNVSFKSKDQILSSIKKNYGSDTKLNLTALGKQVLVKRSDVGAQINYKDTINSVYSTGRTGNFLQKIVDQNKAFFGISNSRVSVNVSKVLMSVKVLSIADAFNIDPQPKMPDFAGDWNKALPQKDGLKVDTTALTKIILSNIFAPSPTSIKIPTSSIVKKYPDYDMEAIKRQAAQNIAEPISITSGGVVLTLSSKDLKGLLKVSDQADPTNPKKTIMVLALDREKLNKLLYFYAVKVEERAHAEYNDHDTRAAIYSQFYTNTRRLVDVPVGPVPVPSILGETTNTLEKIVYLTFDDGPNIIYQPMLLDILKEKKVLATFYFVGSNSKSYSTTTKRTIADGHVIGDHSLTHVNLSRLQQNQISDEIKTTRDILNGFTTPNNITLFRPPFGGTNSIVENSAQSLGLKQQLWSVDPKDWSDPTTDELLRRVVNNVVPGSVVLLHSNHFSTVKALPLIIDALKAKGYQFKVQS